MSWIEGIGVAVIAGLVLYYIFGIGGGSKVTVIQGRRSGRNWRRAKMIGGLLVIIGVLVGTANFPNGGWSNSYSGLGFCLGVIGIILLVVGKVGYSWFRD